MQEQKRPSLRLQSNHPTTTSLPGWRRQKAFLGLACPETELTNDRWAARTICRINFVPWASCILSRTKTSGNNGKTGAPFYIGRETSAKRRRPQKIVSQVRLPQVRQAWKETLGRCRAQKIVSQVRPGIQRYRW